MIINLCQNLILTKLKSYKESFSENITLKNPLKKIITKLNGRLTVVFLYLKMTYIPLAWEAEFGGHLFNTTLSILTPTQMILMRVTHRDQILLFFRSPIFNTQATVKTWKFAPLMTHLWYILQFLYRMAKIKTLRPLHSYVIVIVQRKNLI